MLPRRVVGSESRIEAGLQPLSPSLRSLFARDFAPIGSSNTKVYLYEMSTVVLPLLLEGADSPIVRRVASSQSALRN